MADWKAGLLGIRNKLKQEVEEVASGKKYVKKSEVEEARLKRLREEEEQERLEKEKRRKKEENKIREKEKALGKQEDGKTALELSKEEVVRRLRALGQPATLFGEEDRDRLQRLLLAERETQVEDDTKGGQQTNTILELQRQQKAKKVPLRADDGKEDGKEPSKGAAKGMKGTTEVDSDGGEEETDPTMAAFKRAAAIIAERRAEETMPVEDRIIKYLKQWSEEWRKDIEDREEDMKNSLSGRQATLQYPETMKYLEVMYERLNKRQVDNELKAGIWMMVCAMRDRNYLYAYDVYLKLAIGNAPWPIGVTSVGIHERSAREKISHVMNVSGQAHIMNDEATRKYLQAMKRMITVVQRLCPTDPSRSVDFNASLDMGRGVKGRGSDKLALLDAEKAGEDWRSLGLPEAPHFVEPDGSVKVPPRWSNILAREGVFQDQQEAQLKKTPPRTPPRAPKSPIN